MKKNFNTLLRTLFFATVLSLSVISPAQAQDDLPDPNAFVMVEKEPTPVNMNDLKRLIGYPKEAQEKEIEGKVIVRILVGEDGKYIKHLVIKNPSPILTKRVEMHLPNLVFTPGIQKGEPIKVWVTIPFDFKLLRDDPPAAATMPEEYAGYSFGSGVATGNEASYMSPENQGKFLYRINERGFLTANYSLSYQEEETSSDVDNRIFLNAAMMQVENLEVTVNKDDVLGLSGGLRVLLPEDAPGTPAGFEGRIDAEFTLLHFGPGYTFQITPIAHIGSGASCPGLMQNQPTEACAREAIDKMKTAFEEKVVSWIKLIGGQ